MTSSGGASASVPVGTRARPPSASSGPRAREHVQLRPRQPRQHLPGAGQVELGEPRERQEPDLERGHGDVVPPTGRAPVRRFDSGGRCRILAGGPGRFARNELHHVGIEVEDLFAVELSTGGRRLLAAHPVRSAAPRRGCGRAAGAGRRAAGARAGGAGVARGGGRARLSRRSTTWTPSTRAWPASGCAAARSGAATPGTAAVTACSSEIPEGTWSSSRPSFARSRTTRSRRRSSTWTGRSSTARTTTPNPTPSSRAGHRLHGGQAAVHRHQHRDDALEETAAPPRAEGDPGRAGGGEERRFYMAIAEENSRPSRR